MYLKNISSVVSLKKESLTEQLNELLLDRVHGQNEEVFFSPEI